ncbi:ABC transporter ATP-binding protein/permease [Tessaracoccus sp. OS52]|uniref:ABC transporter ATP-binding protein n=1 Tax=Tessaracoccus sp. OS52 TaxID=2886691 RepID=UPI001D105442|nr:ABC transporter ATP-binding protein [Tessaracoccus sp. OS52]MCC2593854.1 ABC transporter ATP-binding protein/permease [Tessaracoccus sp. OS52]
MVRKEPVSGQAPSPRALVGVIAPFARPHLWKLVLALVCTILGSAAALMMPQVLGRLIDGPIAAGDRSALLPATLLVGGLGLFEAAMVFTRRLLVLGASTRIEYGARMALFDHLVDLDTTFHDQWPSGQLLTRVTQDLNLIRRWLAFGLIMLISDVVTIGVGVILMAGTNWILALVFFVGSAPLIYLMLRFERQYTRLTRRAQDKSGDVATVVEESVKGIRILKAFGRAPEALAQFGDQAEQLRDLEVARGLADARMFRWLTLIPNVVIAVCLVMSIWFASLGWVTIGGVVAFFATATILRNPLAFLGFLLAFTLDALSALARFKEVMDAAPRISDPDEPTTIPVPLDGAPHGARLEFRNVTFRFDDQGPGEEPLLSGLNLEVHPGERMALVGLTGSGKSTLVNLAARLYEVTSGCILVDGVDVRDVSRHHLREQMTVAFEAPTLFSASIRDNVLLGNPEASDDVLREALDVASADFVGELDGGIDTVIGEEGQGLSGGQRQRLALARAIAAKPRLMLLDDPLSALDVHTEAKVTEALDAALGSTTALIVAHRPSTVALADRVALMDRGQVVAVGTHAELLATSQRYRYVISSFDEPEEAGEAEAELDPDAGYETTGAGEPR